MCISQSHTLDVQGQGHELGVKSAKNKVYGKLLLRNIYLIRHACISQTVAQIQF